MKSDEELFEEWEKNESDNDNVCLAFLAGLEKGRDEWFIDKAILKSLHTEKIKEQEEMLQKLCLEIEILTKQTEIADEYMGWVEAGNQFRKYNDECYEVRRQYETPDKR